MKVMKDVKDMKENKEKNSFMPFMNFMCFMCACGQVLLSFNLTNIRARTTFSPQRPLPA